MHAASVLSVNKYGLVPSVRRWLFSEGHLRRTAGAAKST
jgi:hypothetical protein